MDDFTIEHVLPDSSDSVNGQIGNLIPLEDYLNNRCKAKTVDEKIKIYAESSYASARMFSNRYKENGFDPDKRTEYLAKLFYERILQL